MNTKPIIKALLPAAAFCAVSAVAEEAAPSAGQLLQDMNMFVPEDGAPSIKVQANEKFGTQWAVDAAYSALSATHTVPDSNRKATYALLHAQLNQRLWETSPGVSTWVRAEFSGSWGLDASTARRRKTSITEATGSAHSPHADIFEPHSAVLPELALMQYFAGNRACVIAGMVNLTNYFDAVSLANDSFHSFANASFVNSTILPLPDSNLGAVVQWQPTDTDYLMAAFARTHTEPGYNPFRTGKGYVITAEWGRTWAEGKLTSRITPFIERTPNEDTDGQLKSRTNYGISASLEYAPCDACAFFTRAGFGAEQELGNVFDFSVGTHLRLIPSREDDFLGIAYGVCNATHRGIDWADTGHTMRHRREQNLEIVYNLQITDYFKIMPHYQFTANPNGSERSSAHLFGIQAIFSF